MKIVRSTAPYIRRNSSVKRMMIDVIIALMPVVIFSIVQFGLKAVMTLGISIFVMLLGEFVFVFLTNQIPYDGVKHKLGEKIKYAKSKATINNITAPLISAIIYAMIMPATYNWYHIALGALMGIVIGKLLFGGLGSNIFNPAAVGRIATVLCFGEFLKYGDPLINHTTDVLVSGTPLGALTDAFTNNSLGMISWKTNLDLFLGFVPGSMGEICKAAILLGALYLIIRKSCDFRTILGTICTFMVLMLVAGLTLKTKTNFDVDPFAFMFYQTLSGGLIFGAVFMVTDPVTSPVTRPGRITFGALVAIIAVMIRLFGAYPEGVAFAILISNAFVPVIDYYKWSTNKYNYKHAILWSLMLIIPALIIYFGYRGV